MKKLILSILTIILALLLIGNSIDKCSEVAQINVYNTLCQLLLTQSTNGNDQQTIDISNLPNGLYLVQMIGESRIATKQIIKIQ